MGMRLGLTLELILIIRYKLEMSHNPSYHQVVQEYVALEIKLDFSMPNQGLNKLYYKNIIINLNRKSRVIHSQQKKIDKAKTF